MTLPLPIAIMIATSPLHQLYLRQRLKEIEMEERADYTTKDIEARNAETEQLKTDLKSLVQIASFFRTCAASGEDVGTPAAQAMHEKLKLIADRRAPNDYTKMSSSEVIAFCGDNAQRWATAFCQHVVKHGGGTDPGYVMTWFANAIEKACDTRMAKSKIGNSIHLELLDDRGDAPLKPWLCRLTALVGTTSSRLRVLEARFAERDDAVSHCAAWASALGLVRAERSLPGTTLWVVAP